MSDKHAHIIYYNYLKPDGSGMSVGGIQTYLANLIPVLEKCGYGVSVYQRSYCDFHKNMVAKGKFGQRVLFRLPPTVASKLMVPLNKP